MQLLHTKAPQSLNAHIFPCISMTPNESMKNRMRRTLKANTSRHTVAWVGRSLVIKLTLKCMEQWKHWNALPKNRFRRRRSIHRRSNFSIFALPLKANPIHYPMPHHKRCRTKESSHFISAQKTVNKLWGDASEVRDGILSHGWLASVFTCNLRHEATEPREDFC